MRESRSSGSVEGVVSNHDPYSDSVAHLVCTYMYVHNHATKKENPLDAPSMSPARPEFLYGGTCDKVLTVYNSDCRKPISATILE